MDTVSGTELKLRGYELPAATALAPDQRIPADGPISGPASVTPKALSVEGLRTLDPSPQDVLALLNAALPIVYTTVPGGAPNTVQLFPAYQVFSNLGPLYLGAHATPPTSTGLGLPLKVGMLYYNINDLSLYVYTPSLIWRPAGAAIPAAVRAYYYPIAADTTSIPPAGPGTPDSNGNVLAFDLSAGQTAVDAINVYMNGALLANGADYTVIEGGPAQDYIILAREACANSIVVVQVLGTPDVTYSANAVKAVTTGWVFDGATTTFPLVNAASAPITPGAAVNCLVSRNALLLEPGVGFTVLGSSIVFAVPPDPADYIWVTVGVPVGGGLHEGLTTLKGEIATLLGELRTTYAALRALTSAGDGAPQ